MSAMSIRPATRADLPAILNLLADDQLGREREDPSLPLDPGYLSAFHAIETDPNQLLVVGALEDRVIATLQLSFLPGISHRGAWRGQIEAVRVSGELRGQGLGAELVGWAVEECRTRGCRMVQLTSNASREAAHRFYRKLGFADSHTGFKLAL